MKITISDDFLSVKGKLLKNTAYDIRAYVGEVGSFFSDKALLTPERMRAIGWLMALTEFSTESGEKIALQTGHKVVVGYDNGPTSKALAEAFSKGLTEQGVNVFDVGIASSGQVYHNQEQLQADGYVQITRSHVEVTTNGAKFGIGTQGIHTYLLGQMSKLAENKEIGRDAPLGKVIDKTAQGYELYTDKMKKRYGEYFKKNPRALAVNLFGGTGLKYEPLFKNILGAKLCILGDKLNVNDGKILADPTRREMLEQVPAFNDALDRGLRVHSFDLDADRGSMTEGKGALGLSVSGHYLGDDISFILADHKLTRAVPKLFTKLDGRGISKENLEKIHKIVTTVYMDPRYTSAVRSFVEAKGGATIYHRKGHSLWKETMTANIEEAARLAGFGSAKDFAGATGYQDIQIEASLHLFATDLDDAIPRDDAIENVFLLEKILDELNITSLAEYFEGITRRYATKEVRTNAVSNESKEAVTYAVMDIIREKFSKTASIVEFDGQIRADFETGFVMYGMSNTSPKLTFMVEGETVEERNDALAYIVALHNEVKAKHKDAAPMDVSENQFFIHDSSFNMPEPDKVTTEHPSAKRFSDKF